jgi:hypothetical protein
VISYKNRIDGGKENSSMAPEPLCLMGCIMQGKDFEKKGDNDPQGGTLNKDLIQREIQDFGQLQ